MEREDAFFKIEEIFRTGKYKDEIRKTFDLKEKFNQDLNRRIEEYVAIAYMEGYNQAIRDHGMIPATDEEDKKLFENRKKNFNELRQLGIDITKKKIQKPWNKGKKACKKCKTVHLSGCNKNQEYAR